MSRLVSLFRSVNSRTVGSSDEMLQLSIGEARHAQGRCDESGDVGTRDLQLDSLLATEHRCGSIVFGSVGSPMPRRSRRPLRCVRSVQQRGGPSRDDRA